MNAPSKFEEAEQPDRESAIAQVRAFADMAFSHPNYVAARERLAAMTPAERDRHVAKLSGRIPGRTDAEEHALSFAQMGLVR